MSIDWVKSEAARRAIGYLTDSRPAWLWSADGATLVWCNPAARLFRAKAKRQKLKLSAPAVPIKGQVPRLVRLGSIGRASLSRMQFLAGNKPMSATCTCTPLTLESGDIALLIVAVDPIDKDIMQAHGMSADTLSNIFGDDAEFVVLNAKGKVLASSPEELDYTSKGEGGLTFSAGPGSSKVVLFSSQETQDQADDDPFVDHFAQDENLAAPDEDPDESAQTTHRDLTSLLDKLAADEALFAPLGPEDDAIPEGIDLPATADEPETGDEQSDIADTPATSVDEGEGTALWQIVGRDFEAHDETPPETGKHDTPKSVERASRYNFAELSRILSDRIGQKQHDSSDAQPELHQTNANAPTPTQGELINLSDETLVLNRLPLGLLIFRDQEILFANRVLGDLIGYPDSASLRSAGIKAIFPTPAETGENAGPVTHLAHRDGNRVSVSARLQSITWQGQPSLMLSVKQENGSLGTEAAVRGFAEAMAAVEGNGFFETSRAGIIDSISGRAAELFGRTPDVLIGRPLMLMAGHKDAAPLRHFMDQPARFAETKRPSLLMRGIDPTLEILLFAEGQAGIVTGYFGIVQQVANPVQTPVADPQDHAHIDPAVLGRLSRGMRRPLNTIIGFSELIRSNAFGPIENTRYVEYAHDIKFAGQEIVEVIDELEEFVRLNSADYKVVHEDFDLGNLLNTCISRVRHQAGEARVLVRSAISERLPHIRADESSLSQAILNLLASAIEQTPQGGQVVLSAQREDDGAISVHVRDSGTTGGDLAERFVVFREGTDQNGDALKPVQSSVGLALTQSLLAANTCTLSVDPTAETGTLLSLLIPAELAINSIT